MASGPGRLTARPSTPAGAGETGLFRLGAGGGRDALLYVPEGYAAARPAPLAVMLHGAGGNAQQGLGLLMDHADGVGVILLAPEAGDVTWDLLRGGFGPDVAEIDRTLRHVFDRYAVDPERLAIGGFSDGASYALSLGIMNGDLFTHVVAFSPGFLAPRVQVGAPRLFVSHGTGDRVLPIDRCSRRIVPQLRSAGYEMTYVEFQGPHTVPREIAGRAVEWLVGVGG